MSSFFQRATGTARRLSRAYAFRVRPNFNTREFYRRDCCLFCSTLLEIVFPVLDHIWTQDTSICPLTFEHEMGPYIDQGKSTTRV